MNVTSRAGTSHPVYIGTRIDFIWVQFHFLVVMSAKLSRKSDFQFLVVMSAKLSRKSDFQFIFKLTNICFLEVLSFIYAICIYYYIYWCPT